MDDDHFAESSGGSKGHRQMSPLSSRNGTSARQYQKGESNSQNIEHVYPFTIVLKPPSEQEVPFNSCFCRHAKAVMRRKSC